MWYTRGSSADYDRWANVTGDPGWSWDQLQHYFKKVMTKCVQTVYNHVGLYDLLERAYRSSGRRSRYYWSIQSRATWNQRSLSRHSSGVLSPSRPISDGKSGRRVPVHRGL